MKKISTIISLIVCVAILASCTVKPTVIETSAVTEIRVTITPETLASSGPQAIQLYPANKLNQSERIWGFINQQGEFMIKPKYSMAGDFQTVGLAKIGIDYQFGLIDQQGNLVVKPAYNDIGDFYEGVAIATNWGEKTTNTLLDIKGQIIAQIDGYVSPFKEGLAAAAMIDAKTGSYVYGYIDPKGLWVIPPTYSSAADFENGKALVFITNDTGFYIDKSGQKVGENQEQIPDPASGLFLAYNKTFSDGLKIAGRRADYIDYYGLYSSDGQTILKDEYAGIERVSDQLFVAAKETAAISFYSGLPKALFDKSGKQLTDFTLYDITDAGNGCYSVSDKQYTYLIDATGAELKSLPKIRGNGKLTITHGLVKAEIDQQLSYYDLTGKPIWQEENTCALNDQLKVTRLKMSPDRFLIVFYPEIRGLEDQAMQTTLNEQITKYFTDVKTTNLDGSNAEPGQVYYSQDFTIEANHNLLVIGKNGYDYPIGAAHGQPLQTTLHLDLLTGKTYTLKDLFKADSDYKVRLEKIISAQIADRTQNAGEFFDIANPLLNEANFKISKENLELFYSPYEIAAYAAGFPTFKVPYSEILDIIATEGDLWKSIGN